MLRLLKEDKGVLCVATFLSCNIDAQMENRVLLLPVATGDEYPIYVYGIEFDSKESARAFVMTLFECGRANMLELADEVVREGFLKMC